VRDDIAGYGAVSFRRGWVFALGLCLIAFAARVEQLGAAPLWVDEAYTWNAATQSFADLWLRPADVPPPLLYSWTGLALAWFGSTEFALRLASVLPAILLVPSAWSIAGSFGGPRASVLAATIAAISPVAISYGREARMYGPLIGLSALLLVIAYAAGRRPAPTTCARRARARGRAGSRCSCC
jgi:uncharacterized membrane protein